MLNAVCDLPFAEQADFEPDAETCISARNVSTVDAIEAMLSRHGFALEWRYRNGAGVCHYNAWSRGQDAERDLVSVLTEAGTWIFKKQSGDASPLGLRVLDFALWITEE